MRPVAVATALILVGWGIAGCTPRLRGELGVTVDPQGRLVGLIALCPDQELDRLTLTDAAQGGVRVTLRPAGDDRPDSVVLSDPGDAWTDDWPQQPAQGRDPRALTADHEYVLAGVLTGTGSGDGKLDAVTFVPEQVLADPQLRSGMVRTWRAGEVVSVDEFRRLDQC
ncbi:hypothetical protein [Micromonospora purpureochromogenes]|uniref:Uncharacterized protein n=1 Tax=Micromonospora purpureochromogenes TaxID=47872 RepID=A0ABX2RF60_9ACTN|nr:hypothetical protein [Micromonospora purpureochromogenes]NYF55143.1 hypothetical protein [Micromonospora purpureochromogenes]